MLWNKNKLFCELSPTCYAISLQKEIVKRHIKNTFGKERFAKTFQTEKLPNLVAEHSSYLIKKSKGTDITLQKNKVTNIRLASEKINGLILRPGEVFTFWGTVGNPSKRKGYLNGRVITKDGLTAGLGGGLCNLANTLHLLVLHSPLTVTELHHHSDALSPDEGARVPLSAGTSVSYNNLDYRVKNETDQNFQFCVWCEGEYSYAQLRGEKEIPQRYRIVEEDHHFVKEGNEYYRVSKIYRETLNGKTGSLIAKELIWDNHSLVMYDPSLIPQEQIRDP